MGYAKFQIPNMYKILKKDHFKLFWSLVIDKSVKNPKVPSPLMGEGQGEGE